MFRVIEVTLLKLMNLSYDITKITSCLDFSILIYTGNEILSYCKM